MEKKEKKNLWWTRWRSLVDASSEHGIHSHFAKYKSGLLFEAPELKYQCICLTLLFIFVFGEWIYGQVGWVIWMDIWMVFVFFVFLSFRFFGCVTYLKGNEERREETHILRNIRRGYCLKWRYQIVIFSPLYLLWDVFFFFFFSLWIYGIYWHYISLWIFIFLIFDGFVLSFLKSDLKGYQLCVGFWDLRSGACLKKWTCRFFFFPCFLFKMCYDTILRV